METCIKMMRKRDFLLLAEKNPRAAAQKLGLNVSPDVNIKITKNTPKVMHLVLPPQPFQAIGDKGLDHVAGGTGAPSTDNPWSIILAQHHLYDS